MQTKSPPPVGFAELKAFLASRRKSREQRRERRYQTNDAVEVEILQTGFQRVAASVVNISRSGLGLFSEMTIGKGAQVKITIEKHAVIFGEVQYCRPARGGFHSGVVIQDAFYPVRKTAKPKETEDSRSRRRERK
jgi:hypothetical protein